MSRSAGTLTEDEALRCDLALCAMIDAADLYNQVGGITEQKNDGVSVSYAPTELKTLYVMGGFGAPLNKANKDRYTGPNANEYNRRPERTAMILAADADTFAFDCIGLIKGILWGWDGNKDRTYGGAIYASNNVPDLGADTMITKCSGISTMFSNIIPGEMLWKEGHAGIYLGNGLAAECTPLWDNDVQITGVANIGTVEGISHHRTWTKHGRLPWIDYSVLPGSEPATTIFQQIAKKLREIAELLE